MENAHAKETADILAHFVVDEETGLSPDQFQSYLAKYGYNGELGAGGETGGQRGGRGRGGGTRT